jgi:hypothetical protein
MTLEEVDEVAKEFDDEFVAERAKPMSPEQTVSWERVQANLIKGEQVANGDIEQTIAIRLDKKLLDRCTALAKKKRLSRDALVARGLRTLLAAEGE